MSSRATSSAIACLAVTLSLGGCGLSDPYNNAPPRRHGAVAATGVRHAVVPRPPTGLGGATPLRRFAALYSNRSAGSAASDGRALIALSTGSLARLLRRDRGLSAVEAVHGMPAGARLVGTVSILHLVADSPRSERGEVLVAEQLQLADGATETPVIERYAASLKRTDGGWRVASFTPAG